MPRGAAATGGRGRARTPTSASSSGSSPRRSSERHGVEQRFAAAASEVRRHRVRGVADEHDPAAHVRSRGAASVQMRWASVVSGSAAASTRAERRVRGRGWPWRDVLERRRRRRRAAGRDRSGTRRTSSCPSRCGPSPKSRPRPQYSPSWPRRQRPREATPRTARNGVELEHRLDRAPAATGARYCARRRRRRRASPRLRDDVDRRAR